MSSEMTPELDLGFFPSAEGLGRARESGSETEVVEQAVGVQVMEVPSVPVHGLLEGPVEKPDVGERKGMDGDRDLSFNLLNPGAFFPLAGGARKNKEEDAKPGQQWPRLLGHGKPPDWIIIEGRGGHSHPSGNNHRPL
jgi:hypothetical protein